MARVEVYEDQDYWYINMPYDDAAKEELKKQFKARWNPEDKTWVIVRGDYPDKNAIIKELHVHFPRDI